MLPPWWIRRILLVPIMLVVSVLAVITLPLTALLAAAVAFITVALQSWKTANADPVNTLRHV